MNEPKKIRRKLAHKLQKQVRALLEKSQMGRGAPGRCGGATPAQIKAGAKTIVRRLMADNRLPKIASVAG